MYSAGTGVTTNGHSLGIIDVTAGNWTWVQYIASSTGPGFIESPNFMVQCWSSANDVTGHACDTGLSRDSTGVVDVGNGTAGDTSGAINAALYKGPATAPSGSCSVIGWAFSQDGHATFCNGSTWVTKI